MTGVDLELMLAQTAWLRRLALQLAGDAHVADDLVQDTWLMTLARPPRVRGHEGSLRRWLARVVHNAARMRQRSDARRTARERLVAVSADDDSHSIEALEAQQRLLDAVMELKTEHRQVVVLRYLEGLPPRVIAQRLGCTAVAVRSRLARALASLRARLAPDGERHALGLALLPLLRRGAWPARRLLLWTQIMRGSTKVVLSVLVAGAGLASWMLLRADGGASEAPAVGAVAPRSVAGMQAAGEHGRDAIPAVDPGAATETSRTAVETPPQRGAAADTRLVVMGRCVDAAGRGIAGARLTATEVVGKPFAVTDDAGRATLELDWPAPLSEGNRHWIVVEASGDGLTRITRQERIQGTGELRISLGDLELGPGGAVTGVVHDFDGSPLPRARVWVARATTPTGGAVEERRRVHGHGFVGLGFGVWAWAETDADGRYRIDGLPAGSVSVVARRSGRLCAYTPPLSIEPGEEAQAPTLVLAEVPRANAISGWARDSEGEALAGARVSVFANRGPRNIDAMTGTAVAADGSFALTVLAAQSATLELELRGAERRKLLRHDVAAGTRDVELRLPPPRPFLLVLTGTGGARLQPTGAWAYDTDDHYLDLGWMRGDDGGRIPLAPDQPFTLLVQADGYLRKRLGPFEPDAVPARIEAVLEPAGVVTGRVLAQGRPVAGARVHAHRADPDQALHRFAHDVFTRFEAALRPAATTDADGRFELQVVRDGDYVLHGEAEGWAQAESAELTLKLGSPMPAVDLHLQPVCRVEGRVLVGPGGSAEGQVIAATRGDGHAEVCVADGEGRYHFAGLAPGSWQVRACRPDDQEWLRMARTWPEYDREQLPVDVVLLPGQVATFDVDLRARSSALVQGRVAVDGVGADGWRVSIWCDGEYLLCETDASGRFEQRAAVGKTTMHLFGRLPGGGELHLQRALELASGPNPVAVDVTTGGVELTGLAPSAPPPEEDRSEGYALVWQEGGEVRCTYRFDPDADGRHRAVALPVGRAQLRRRTDDRTDPQAWRPMCEVEITAGLTAAVLVR